MSSNQVLGISEDRWKKAQKAEARYWTKLVDSQNNPFFERTKEFYDYFNDYFRNQNYDTVIEFGCGPVGLLPHVTARKKIGIDPLASKFSEMGYEYTKHDYCIINSKGENTPLLNCYADLVLCVNVLDHSQIPMKLLEEVFRVCQYEGRIILSCDLRDKDSQTDLWHPNKISAEEIENFFKEKRCYVEYKKILPPHFIMDGVEPPSGTLNIVVVKKK